MPTRFTEVRISSPVSSMSLRAKDHLEGTKVAVFPSLCAAQESPVRQRSGLAVTKEWRPGRRRATWLPEEDPETSAEWMTVLRYGHLRSAPVVVDVGFKHGVGTAYTRCSFIGLHAPAWAPPRWLAPSPATRKRVYDATRYVWLQCKGPEVRERGKVKRSQSAYRLGLYRPPRRAVTDGVLFLGKSIFPCLCPQLAVSRHRVITESIFLTFDLVLTHSISTPSRARCSIW